MLIFFANITNMKTFFMKFVNPVKIRAWFSQKYGIVDRVTE